MEEDNADIMYLDFSKPFHTVSQYRLLMKIMNLGISKKKKVKVVWYFNG